MGGLHPDQIWEKRTASGRYEEGAKGSRHDTMGTGGLVLWVQSHGVEWQHVLLVHTIWQQDKGGGRQSGDVRGLSPLGVHVGGVQRSRRGWVDDLASSGRVEIGGARPHGVKSHKGTGDQVMGSHLEIPGEPQGVPEHST